MGMTFLGFNTLSDFYIKYIFHITKRFPLVCEAPHLPTLIALLASREKNCFLNIDFLSHCQGHPVSREPHLLLPPYIDLELCHLPSSISRAKAKLQSWPRAEILGIQARSKGITALLHFRSHYWTSNFSLQCSWAHLALWSSSLSSLPPPHHYHHHQFFFSLEGFLGGKRI